MPRQCHDLADEGEGDGDERVNDSPALAEWLSHPTWALSGLLTWRMMKMEMAMSKSMPHRHWLSYPIWALSGPLTWRTMEKEPLMRA